MSGERSDWFCSECRAYKDPQQLNNGICWKCEDSMESPKLSGNAAKMYILILDDVPVGHAINSAAHAALACYVKHAHIPHVQEWLKHSFKKVTCRVNVTEFEQALNLADNFVIISESALDDKVMCAAFAPRTEWNPFFKTLKLWQ